MRFAWLYFDAIAAADPPSAWRPLFASAERRGILPLQFAFAGMNAHINRDLPVALVETWGELGLEPRAGGPTTPTSCASTSSWPRSRSA